MTELQKLFSEEEKIRDGVHAIAEGILELSEHVVDKGVLELAGAEVVGKRVRKACDDINDEVHLARKQLGVLLSHSSEVKFKKSVRSLNEMEDELSLIHGDIDVIGRVAENFFQSGNRKAAFSNLNRHYGELVEHVTSLMVEEAKLKKLL